MLMLDDLKEQLKKYTQLRVSTQRSLEQIIGAIFVLEEQIKSLKLKELAKAKEQEEKMIEKKDKEDLAELDKM